MLSLINVSLSPPSSLSNTNLKRKEFYFWSEYRLDLHGRVGSWHGDLDQGLMATLQEHGIGIEAQEASLSSLGPQEDCPALCHPPRWPVSRGHRGRGAGEPGCSWVRGLGVAALKGPQRPILPHTTQQGSERAVPLSRVTQQVSGRRGARTQGSHLSARARSWMSAAPKEASNTELWWGLGGGSGRRVWNS